MAYVETLTGIDIESGKKVWQSLRANEDFPFQGIFWLLKKSGIWHLMIATSRSDDVGPRKAYEELEEATHLLATDLNQFLKIELISPKDPFYQGLRSVYGQSASVEGTRLSNTQIQGMYVDAAYLYEIR